MKRKLALAVALILVLNGSAFAKTNEIILFRDISWYVGIDDVFSSIKDINNEDDPNYTKDYDIGDWYDKYEETENGGITFTIWYSDGELDVAGHSVNNVNIDAVYGVVNGSVSELIEDSKFVRASYVFSGDDTSYIYDDLYDKLCELYGDPYAEDSFFDDTAEWRGANNTAVRLVYMSGFLSDKVRLEYGVTNVDDLLDMVVEARSGSDANNKSGL